MEEYMLWIWLGVFVITLVVEACTQNIVSVWFSIGAIVTLIVSFFVPWWAEIIIFVVISVVSLICTRPIVNKLMDRNKRNTNTDDFIGKRVKTITEVSKYDAGEVKLNGVVYSAILKEDVYDSIASDKIVEVVAIKGNKLVVKEIEGEN